MIAPKGEQNNPTYLENLLTQLIWLPRATGIGIEFLLPLPDDTFYISVLATISRSPRKLSRTFLCRIVEISEKKNICIYKHILLQGLLACWVQYLCIWINPLGK